MSDTIPLEGNDYNTYTTRELLDCLEAVRANLVQAEAPHIRRALLWMDVHICFELVRRGIGLPHSKPKRKARTA